jgi:LPXTG-motif cell wall-anchored protein
MFTKFICQLSAGVLLDVPVETPSWISSNKVTILVLVVMLVLGGLIGLFFYRKRHNSRKRP